MIIRGRRHIVMKVEVHSSLKIYNLNTPHNSYLTAGEEEYGDKRNIIIARHNEMNDYDDDVRAYFASYIVTW